MTLRCALVGTGNIAGTYLNAAAAVDAVAITAVVSRSAERAAAFAGEHDIAHHGRDLQAVAAHCDAVIAANPSGEHAAVAMAAAALGKHVLVEKPLDITPEAMTGAIDACRTADVRLGVCYQRRTRPANRAVRELIAAGELGRVLAVDLSLKFYRGQDYYDSAAWRGTRALDGGGPFMQQAIHDIDLLCWLCGTPTSTQAMTATLAHPGIEVEDHGAAVLALPDGGIASVVASTICAPGFPPRMDIICERGSLSLENDRITAWNVDGVARPDDGAAAAGHNAGTSAAVTDTSAHQAVLADFAAAVADGREPLCSGQDARAATDVVWAIYRSAESGRQETVG